jgi:hypothetical protein
MLQIHPCIMQKLSNALGFCISEPASCSLENALPWDWGYKSHEYFCFLKRFISLCSKINKLNHSVALLVVNFFTTSPEPCFYSCFALPLFQFNQTRWLSTKSNATLLPPLHLILSSANPTTNNPKTSKPNFIPPSTRYPLLRFAIIGQPTLRSRVTICQW